MALTAGMLACGSVLSQPLPGGDCTPVVARYRVSVDTGWDAPGTPSDEQAWVFVREPDRVALSQGDREEIWRRLPNGSVTLQRVLHRQQRVIDYSAGELAALHIEVDWAALSRLASPAPAASIEWDDSVQLPRRITQRLAGHTRVRIELLQWAPTAPADWVLPGSRSAGYLHIDAADFGDMAYDPAVRAAEALDVRAGWRPHGHRH